MDHMLRHGMWAPVETRLFHHIILVCARNLIFLSTSYLCLRLMLPRLSILYHSHHH